MTVTDTPGAVTEISCATRSRFVTRAFRIVSPGICLGISLGLVATLSQIVNNAYLKFGMLHTAISILVPAVDAFALASVILLVCASLLMRLGKAIPGRWGKGLAVFLPIFLVLVVIGGYIVLVAPVRIEAQFLLNHWTPGFTASFRNGSAYRILGIVVLVSFIGFYLARRLWRPCVTLQPVVSRIGRFVLIGIAWLGIAVFFLLNVAYLGLSLRARQAVAHRPNVIFIMVDTLRADHLGCYGYDLNTTPHIDAFARESIRFTDVISQAPYTAWSVSSLMSSQYPEMMFPFDIAFVGYENPAYPVMFAETLREAGYHTSAIVSNPILERQTAIVSQGYQDYSDHIAALASQQPTGQMVTDEALNTVRKLKHDKFFLSLVYMDPHDPYLPHADFRFNASPSSAGVTRMIAQRYPKDCTNIRRDTLPLYDGEIAYTDAQIGRLLDGLKKAGVYDDSLIVFFSDHGEAFGEHGTFGHRFVVYEEAIRVPLLIKLPGKQQGRTISGSFALLDVVPSLMQYLHLDASRLDLRGHAVDLTATERTAAVPLYSTGLEGAQCVRYQGTKFIRTLDFEALGQTPYTQPLAQLPILSEEMYRLNVDLHEQRNILTAVPLQVNPYRSLLQARDHEMRRYLSQAMQSTTFYLGMQAVRTQEKANTLERLKSLGYIGTSQ